MLIFFNFIAKDKAGIMFFHNKIEYGGIREFLFEDFPAFLTTFSSNHIKSFWFKEYFILLKQIKIIID